jgi:hypothetical protein
MKMRDLLFPKRKVRRGANQHLINESSSDLLTERAQLSSAA